MHCAASVQSKTFDLLGTFVSHMIHLSLSLRLSGNMRRFRACLAKVVSSKLKVLTEPPPREADEYRGFCLGLFLSRGPAAARRRTLLWWWSNGDWRDTSSIQHYPRDNGGPRLSLEELNKEMTHTILAVISSRTPSTFPRHRWTGADLSADALGLMLCLHGVLIDAYLAFLVASGHKEARAWNPRQPSAPSDTGALMDLGIGESARGSGEVDSDSDQEDLQPDLEEPAIAIVAASENVAQQDECDWAKLNGKFRRGGFAFVKELPLGKMMLMRKCMEPLRVLMVENLRLSGAAWEDEQRASDVGEGPPGQSRSFRVLEAANHTLELAFFERLQSTLHDEGWSQHMSWNCLAERFNCLAFRLLSRSGCAVQELL